MTDTYGGSADSKGGAIYMYSGGNLTLTDMTFTNNTAVGESGGNGYGGAIYLEYDNTVAISNSTFTSNTAQGGQVSGAGVGGFAYGGAIYAETNCQVTITNTDITNNLAQGGSNTITVSGSSYGGALYFATSSTLDFDGGALTGNQALGADATTNSGGGMAQGGALSAQALTDISLANLDPIINNQAVGGDGGTNGFGGSAAGGALYLQDYADLTLEGISSISDNTAMGGAAPGAAPGGSASGGALYAGQNGTVTGLSGITFDTNLAQGGSGGNSGGQAYGGAIYLNATAPSIIAATFTNNTAQGGDGNLANGGTAYGGAIYSSNFGSIGTLSSSTFTSNDALGGGSTDNSGGGANAGALYLNIDVTVFTDNTFTSNQALGGSGKSSSAVQAGAVFYSGFSVSFTGNDFVNNTAQSGDSTAGNTGSAEGGGLNFQGLANNFSDILVSGNRAQSGLATSGSSGTASGGGIFSEGEIQIFSNVTVQNNTARSGDATNSTGEVAGGGLLADGDFVDFTDVTISGNTAVSGDGRSSGDVEGGGFEIGYQVTKMSNVTVTNNTASAGSGSNGDGGGAWGGGLSNQGEISLLSNSTFSGNSATGGAGSSYGGGAYGGGIANRYKISYISDVEVLINSVTAGTGGTNSGGEASGGGLHTEYQIVEISDSNFSSNSVQAGDTTSGFGAYAYGGGISNYYRDISQISGVTISGNSVVAGDTGNSNEDGGIADGGGYASLGTNVYLEMFNSTVSGNTLTAGVTAGGGSGVDGEAFGAGLYLDRRATLRHVTVLANSGGDYGEAIYSEDSSNSLVASLLASPGGIDDCEGSFTDGGSNFGAAGDASCPTVGSITLGTDINSTLADNGGPTKTHALLPGSTAINATGSTCGQVGNVDQRGEARDSSCDSGAFELTDPDLTVAKTNNVSGATDPTTTWTWTVTVTNSGGPDAVFDDGETILTDDLPSGPTYTNLQLSGQTDVSGPLACDYDTSSAGAITCYASGGTVTLTGGSSTFTVTIDAIAPTGTYLNPASSGVCKVDPDNLFTENNESDNTCGDTVVVSYDATVTITASDPDAAENPLDNGAFTVDLGSTNSTGSAITVNYSVAGTASAGVDYNILSGSVSIPNGSQTAVISVVPFDDSFSEGDETVVVTLTSTDTSGVTVDTNPATVTIEDNEAPISSTATISATDNSAAENPLGNGEFTIDLGVTNTTGSAITVSYAISGTASNSVDYNTLSGSAQVASGDQTVTVDVVPFDDTLFEGSETVTLTLTGTDNGGVGVDTTPATVTITDDEGPTLTVAGAGNANGSMTASGTISCTSQAGTTSGDCEENAAVSTNFSILASPTGSATFGGWTGCDSTTATVVSGDTCQLSLTADTTVTASFEDNIPPTVLSIELLDGTDINGGDTVNAGVIFLVVTFSEDVLDYAGLHDIDDVTNPGNFTLTENGVTNIPITMVSYSNNGGAGPFQAFVVVNTGDFLETANYTFTVNGHTSVTDYGGNSLDGDGNGASGDDFSLAFAVNAPAPATTVTTITGGTGDVSDALASINGLPGTGFAPGVVTQLPAQPAEKAYLAASALWLEIPKLGVQMDIVGVPFADGTWDVSWLGEDAGWLAGTAYPTLKGNTVLTGHVYDAFGNAGLFANLRQLALGDTFSIHENGLIYTYEITGSYQVYADDLRPLGHQDGDVVTLLTCEGYNLSTGEYLYRRAVQGELVSIRSE